MIRLQDMRRPPSGPPRRTITDTWLCRRCGRSLSLRHLYRWIGQGKARRRVCLECLGTRGEA